MGVAMIALVFASLKSWSGHVLPSTTVMILLLTGQTQAAPTVDLKIMSFNIRQDDGSIGNRINSNGWYTLLSTSGGRKDRAVSVINTFAPDILGVEEMLPNQFTDLTNAAPLAGFSYFGQGRNGGNVGERCGIFYRSSRFTAVNQGEFWLSTTPTVPGTTFTGGGTDTGNPRMADWLILHDNQSLQDYFVLNTHWSLDSQARNLSGNFIREQIKAMAGDLPLIVLGDFNTTLGTTAMNNLTGVNDPTGFQLTDAYRHVFPTVGPNEATFHNFTGNTSGSSIDHIFYSADTFTAKSANIVHTSFPTNLYPSDHFPVTATLQVAVVPEASSLTLLAVGLTGLVVLRRRSSEQ